MPGQSDLPKQLWIDLSQAEEQHLSYEQIEAFVDSRLDAIEAELVRAHADLCDQCAAELNDLAEFAKSLKSKVLTIPDRVTIWDRIASWFKIPRNLWATAGIATALMVVLTMRQSMFIHGNAPGSTAAGESAQTQPNVPTTPSMPESASSQEILLRRRRRRNPRALKEVHLQRPQTATSIQLKRCLTLLPARRRLHPRKMESGQTTACFLARKLQPTTPKSPLHQMIPSPAPPSISSIPCSARQRKSIGGSRRGEARMLKKLGSFFSSWTN